MKNTETLKKSAKTSIQSNVTIYFSLIKIVQFNKSSEKFYKNNSVYFNTICTMITTLVSMNFNLKILPLFLE